MNTKTGSVAAGRNLNPLLSEHTSRVLDIQTYLTITYVTDKYVNLVITKHLSLIPVFLLQLLSHSLIWFQFLNVYCNSIMPGADGCGRRNVAYIMKLIFKGRDYVFSHLMFSEVIVLALGHHLYNVCYFTNALKCISHVEVPFPLLYVCRWADKFCLHCNIFIYIRYIWIKPVLCSRMVSLFHHTSP